MTGVIYAIATMDTKGNELDYLARCMRQADAVVKTVDVGTLSEPTVQPDVRRDEILGGRELPANDDRGSAVTVMSDALTHWLRAECQQHRVSGLIGLGGSGGTALISAAMRNLPIGLPKLMLSTVASGNTAPYVGCSDICMMYSVVDIAGVNKVTEQVLSNAGHAMVGMVQNRSSSSSSSSSTKGTLGMTMFGVTTPCVTAVREQLESLGYDCLVFHATGTGGRAMEQLVDSGLITGVLDITTTEVADQVVGGVMPAGEHRFEALVQRRIPLVLSLGAVDMVNFGSQDSVPAEFRARQLHVHNAQVTLMRTTAHENRLIAQWIANKLNQSTAPVRVLLPMGGVSALDAPGQPFYDPETDQALFDELDECLQQTPDRQLVHLPHHINEAAFASALVEHFQAVSSS